MTLTRNLFDQYSQPENQITHALVSSLIADRALLRSFLTEFSEHTLPVSCQPIIQEQSLPGSETTTESEAERRGLPDAVIHDGESWCLAIESKIAATPTIDQLKRHARSLERRGFSDTEILLITATHPNERLQNHCNCIRWDQIYSWFKSHSLRSEWAAQAADYIEIKEQKMIEDRYLREGNLTKFTGIDFGPDQPYNYYEAKRLLRLATTELRKHEELRDDLDADLDGIGRSAITGTGSYFVWDFIPLSGVAFSKSLHLTLTIEIDRIAAHLTIPNGIDTKTRNNLKKMGPDGFRALLLEVEGNLRSVLSRAPGSAPWCWGLQRRYPTQRSEPIIHARLEYDLRTARPNEAQDLEVKPMSSWVEATFDAFAKKRSASANYQLAVGATFPYSRCPTVNSPEIISVIADTWRACKPLLIAMRG